ncbi:MAG: hypothetical protein U9Q40_03420 [Campylobacterota bacterium]|nr:hypothetical protein [Campylobacterota bacterium]
MEISSQTNNFQAMNSHQKPITTPVEPKEPTYGNKEIYEASQGNLIRNEGEVVLTPQGQNNLSNSQDAKAAQQQAQAQEQKDAQRGVAVDYLGAKSKQSQVEIYLAVATDGEYSSGNSTASVIESLRDVQKQNNAVEAYATYKEQQNNPVESFARGLAG